MPAASVKTQRFASPRVVRLIERIRGLVAEQRRLERVGVGQAAIGREIARLQEQLASLVRAELAQVEPAST